MHRTIILAFMLMGISVMYAQTDYTSKIENPVLNQA